MPPLDLLSGLGSGTFQQSHDNCLVDSGDHIISQNKKHMQNDMQETLPLQKKSSRRSSVISKLAHADAAIHADALTVHVLVLQNGHGHLRKLLGRT